MKTCSFKLIRTHTQTVTDINDSVLSSANVTLGLLNKILRFHFVFAERIFNRLLIMFILLFSVISSVLMTAIDKRDCQSLLFFFLIIFSVFSLSLYNLLCVIHMEVPFLCLGCYVGLKCNGLSFVCILFNPLPVARVTEWRIAPRLSQTDIFSPG